MNVFKVFGPPGTGKTTFLLKKVEEMLALNVAPQDIGFFSFTNKAADEAQVRAIAQFPKYAPSEFRFFRTLHSLALEAIGGAANFTTMGKEDWDGLGDKLGLTFTSTGKQQHWDEQVAWEGNTLGDKIRALCDLARLRGCSLAEAWKRSDLEGATLGEITRFSEALKLYKGHKGMIDFCDMLEMACHSPSLPSFKLLIVDEAQDLSSLQWNLVEKLTERAGVTYVAGDDDQAIFQWAGADVKRYHEFKGETVVLAQSYRIPKAVHGAALRLQTGIKDRVVKAYEPRDELGSIRRHHVLDAAVLGLAEGQWLMLCRNNYQIKSFVDLCVQQGYWFSCKLTSIRSGCVPAVVAWEKLRKGETVTVGEALACYGFITSRGKGIEHGYKTILQEEEADKQLNMGDLHGRFGLRTESIWYEAFDALSPTEISYLRSCRRNGEKLRNEPRIKISTIHGAKGGEADNVVLLSDYSRATDSNCRRFPSDEHRVWYVGATRARSALHVIMPQTTVFFRPILHV